MDSFDVRISPRALEQLERYIDYTQYTLLNDTAARQIWQDALDTIERLSRSAGSLAICKSPQLQQLGYRAIRFSRHRYIMLYRIADGTAFVDAVYHELQDYEATFADELTDH